MENKESVERSVYIEMRKMGFRDSNKGTAMLRELVSILIKSSPTSANYYKAVAGLAKSYGIEKASLKRTIGIAVDNALTHGNYDYIVESIGTIELSSTGTGVKEFALRMASMKKYEVDFSKSYSAEFRSIVIEDVQNATLATLEVVHGIMQYLNAKESEVMV